MGCNCLVDQLRLPNFCLGHGKPELFVKSQFGCKRFYLLWPLFWAIVHLALLILDVYYWYDKTNLPAGRWFIYPSRWNYFFLTITVILNCVCQTWVLVVNRSLMEGDEDKLPWYLKVVWLLSNCWASSTFFAAIAFFVAEGEAHFSSITLNSVAMIYSLLDILFSARPMRLFHAYQPMLYVTVYAFFSYIDQLSYKRLYYFIDWAKHLQALSVFFLVILVGIPVTHAILFLICHLRASLPAYESSSSKVEFVSNGVTYVAEEESVRF